MKTTARFAAVAALAAAVFLCAGAVVARAAGRTDARLDAIKNQIMPRVSELRGLAFIRDVKLKVVTPEDVAAFVRKTYDEEVTPDQMEASQRIFVYMGLLDPGANLKDILINMYGQQVAGFYDPKEKTFSVVENSGLPPEVDTITIAHELTHALQDQHFGMEKLKKYAENNDDLSMALMALAEGDANDVMMRYAAKSYPRGKGPVVDFSPFISISMGSSSIPSLPMVITQDLTFPYKYGSRFVAELMKRGGPKAVDAAFAHPPLSTKQVMDPDRYFSADEPYLVEIPDVSACLGTGWRRLDQMPLGQFNLGLYLANSLGSYGIDEVIKPWKGDTMAAYVGPAPNDFLFVYYSLWDSETGAVHFAETYRRLIETRFPALEPGVAAGNAMTWKKGSELYYLKQTGAEVFSIESVPAAAAADVIIKVGEATNAPLTVIHPIRDTDRIQPGK